MKTALASLLVLLAVPSFAQPPSDTARAEAARRLQFLTGEWTGEGWIVLGRGKKATFKQTEKVRLAAGGTVLVIDGEGTSTDSGSEGKVIHQAFAVVSFDPASKKYTFRAFSKAHGEMAVEPKIDGQTLVWGFPTPGGQSRFTITVTDGQWKETGEFSRDGAKWSQFFEMALKKKG